MLRFIFCFLLLGTAVSAADGIDGQIQALNPDWKIRAKAVGDLNNDGIDDVAVILGQGADDESGDHAAALRVYFGMAAGKFLLKTDASRAVCIKCGGTKGEDLPFKIVIGGGVLRLTYVGGTREVLKLSTSWRADGGDILLVGVDQSVTDMSVNQTGKVYSIDRFVDLGTLKMTEKVSRVLGAGATTTVKSTTKISTCSVPPEFQGVKLSTYSHGSLKIPKCSDVQLNSED